MFLFVVFLGVITFTFVWMKWKHSFWKLNGVAGPEPTFLVGNIGSTIVFSEHWGVVTERWYKEYSNEPYVGYYKMLQPAIIPRDPDLVKDILITNFNKFRDNESNLSKKWDPLLAVNPFFERDEEWRTSRKTIMPVFSQSKTKTIMPVMNGVAEDFVKYIRAIPSGEDVDARDLAIRFTTENVIKCAFSIDPGCFSKDGQSEFLEIGKRMFAPSTLAGLKFLMMPILPKWVLDIIPASFIPASVDRTFRSLVGDNKLSRSNDQSADIFQALLQLQQKHNFDDTFLAAHALSLFIDGTETSATTLSFALYELAMNPHCQDKLYEEITSTMAKHDGKLTFEAIEEMIYLEGVLLEALRKHPAVLVTAKVCTEEYTLPKTSGQSKPVTIRPGTVINIPVSAIHMDPNNYPNPEDFQPERFNEEEQRNRHKGTFLGFGEGPRICLGMRFAIAQLKIGLAHLTLNFRLKISPNQKPIVLDPQTLLSYPKDGLLIRIEAR